MISLRNTNRDFNRWKKQMGFPRELRRYDLRGSYASFLLHTGADVRTVMALIGHADSMTTMKMYVRSDSRMKAKVVTACFGHSEGVRRRNQSEKS